MVTRKNAFYIKENGVINPDEWLNYVAMQRSESSLHLIRHALALSQLTGTMEYTPLGTNLLQQSLIMADLLLDLFMDEEIIATALVYNSVQYAELGLSIVQEQLGSNVAKLLRDAVRMESINHALDSPPKLDQIENIRKMLLAMANDMRVVILKLAERTAHMRARKQQSEKSFSSKQYAQDTLNIYASLANRLGINSLKCELEDLSFEQLAPRMYRKLTQLLQEKLLDREAYVQELVATIEAALHQIDIQDFNITSRVKHIYSIYLKMQKKNLELHDIHDLNAVRITVNTIEECYKVLKTIQMLWSILPGQFDDYIAHPKENGYRSIHTYIQGPDKKIIEIQIRTYEMHQESEHGMAAHWQYKEGIPQKLSYQAKIAWLRQVTAWQKELVKQGGYFVPELANTLDDRVYIVTQHDGIIDLPKGATVLDFAYHLQTTIGHHCQGAIVNNVSVPLTHILDTGAQVEILLSKKPNLHRDWLKSELGYLHTAKAKAKVLHWFKQKDHHRHILIGKRLLKKECLRLGIQAIDQEKLAADLHYKSYTEFLAVLGSGELRIAQILHTLRIHQKTQNTSLNRSAAEPLPEFKPVFNIIVNDVNHTINRIARCCKPIPGDIIFGVNTQQGIVLHRQNCTYTLALKQSIIQSLSNISWIPSDAFALYTYPVDICIEANYHLGLVKELFELIIQSQWNLISFANTNQQINQRTRLNLTIEMQNIELLNQALEKLKCISRVVNVYRV